MPENIIWAGFTVAAIIVAVVITARFLPRTDAPAPVAATECEEALRAWREREEKAVELRSEASWWERIDDYHSYMESPNREVNRACAGQWRVCRDDETGADYLHQHRCPPW